MYPNDLRPEENHGYRTKYNGLNKLSLVVKPNNYLYFNPNTIPML